METRSLLNALKLTIEPEIKVGRHEGDSSTPFIVH